MTRTPSCLSLVRLWNATRAISERAARHVAQRDTAAVMVCGGFPNSHAEVCRTLARAHHAAAWQRERSIARAPALPPRPVHALSATSHCSAWFGRVHATFVPHCCAIWCDEIAFFRHRTDAHAAQPVLFACCGRSEMAGPSRVGRCSARTRRDVRTKAAPRAGVWSVRGASADEPSGLGLLRRLLGGALCRIAGRACGIDASMACCLLMLDQTIKTRESSAPLYPLQAGSHTSASPGCAIAFSRVSDVRKCDGAAEYRPAAGRTRHPGSRAERMLRRGPARRLAEQDGRRRDLLVGNPRESTSPRSAAGSGRGRSPCGRFEAPVSPKLSCATRSARYRRATSCCATRARGRAVSRS